MYKHTFISSPELKAQVSFSDRLLSIVCSSVCLSVRLSICLLTIHIFNFFSRTTGPTSTKLDRKHPWVEGIQVCSNERPRPFPRGDNSQNVNLYWKCFKIFLSRTTGPFSTKFTWHKASLVGGDSSFFFCGSNCYQKLDSVKCIFTNMST